ncbi:hypothetical protein BDZ45DRAFT_335567 [Acephala macrosclerotiorum]|nr:hypothetical protein BDZ45DRAFT_335567 [Acephala macrosclerotiorum]
MSDNIEPAFIGIELNEYPIAGVDEVGDVGYIAGDMQEDQDAVDVNDQDQDGQVEGAGMIANDEVEDHDLGEVDTPGQQDALPGDNQDGKPDAAAPGPLDVSNGAAENGHNDLEAAPPAGNVVHAYPQPGGGMDYFLFINLLFMVSSIVISFLSDPAYNARLAAKKLSGLFINMPQRALRIFNWSFIGVWVATFVIHALRGEWSRLDVFRQKCLRLICLGLGVTALFLKWIEPEHINLSYAPGVITLAVEITYLCIDVIADAAIFFFDTVFPWLATTGKPLISFLGALVMVIIIWALYRG